MWGAVIGDIAGSRFEGIQQSRRWNPGDAANVFVRVILSDAGVN